MLKESQMSKKLYDIPPSSPTTYFTRLSTARMLATLSLVFVFFWSI